MAGAVMSLGMALQSAKGIVDTWNNTELTFGEKLITTMSSGGMAIMMLASAMDALKKAEVGELVAKLANTAATAK
jgi:hypothetical protein